MLEAFFPPADFIKASRNAFDKPPWQKIVSPTIDIAFTEVHNCFPTNRFLCSFIQAFYIRCFDTKSCANFLCPISCSSSPSKLTSSLVGPGSGISIFWLNMELILKEFLYGLSQKNFYGGLGTSKRQRKYSDKESSLQNQESLTFICTILD